MSDRLTLANDSFELELDPAIGGAVTAFRRRTTDGQGLAIFRDATPDLDDAGNASAFPLVPFCNRIRGGAFTFRGREVRLTPNMAGDPSPLHGQGWRSAWGVADTTATSAELQFSHPAGEWPWAYEARQKFRLDDKGLDYVLSLRNVSGEPMPAGLGLHPYFPCNAETVLDAPVTTVWTVDENVLPVAREPAAGRYDLHERHIDSAGLDNGYGGWNSEAWITWPDRRLRLRMRSPGARFFQVYAPVSGGVFVAEPVTHANAALNEPEAAWRDLGLRVLIPDEEMRLKVRFDVAVDA